MFSLYSTTFNMKYIVHAEILQNDDCRVETDRLEAALLNEIRTFGSIRSGQCLLGSTFDDETLKNNVINVRFSEATEIQHDCKLDAENLRELPSDRISLQCYTYRLEQEDAQTEDLNCDSDGTREAVSAANHWLLPHISFDGIWENLIYDNSIKQELLEYASTSIIFSQHEVNANVICWNRVVLLYGPPGTGKTSLCKALAQKLSIRLKKYYGMTEFIEINSHSLFSKYYSESGKLVMRMFAKIREHLDFGETLVCVLIDEIESLTHARNSCISGAEPSDSIRVVNAILTQLDQIRKYPNVLILTTSNLKNAIDMAFVDRADLQIYVGPPSAKAIYNIFISCLEELMRVKIITENETSFLYFDFDSEAKDHVDKRCLQLFEVAKISEGLSGRILRKLPFLAYPHFCKTVDNGVLAYVDAIRQAVNQYRLSNDSICASRT